MAGHTFMKKPYLIPIVGFIGYLTLEWIRFILYSMTALGTPKNMIDYGSFMNYFYAYLFPFFQILLIIGFLIFYFETKRKFALVVLIISITALILPLILNDFGYWGLMYAADLEIFQYYGLIYLLTPAFGSLALSIGMGTGFILINRASNPRTGWAKAAAIGLIFTGILMYFLSLIQFLSREMYPPAPPSLYGAKITLNVFALVSLSVACIGCVVLFMKLKWNRIRVTPIEQPGFQFKVRGITIFIMLGFITAASILGLIIVCTTPSSLAISNIIIFIPLLIFLAIFGTRAFLKNKYPSMFGTGLIFQGFLSYMLAIIITFLYFGSYPMSPPLLFVLGMTIVFIGVIIAVIFPWLSTASIQQIERIDMGRVIRYSLWLNLPHLTIFPATVLVMGFFGVHPMMMWDFSRYNEMIQLELILFCCTLLCTVTFMLYHAHRLRMSFRDVLFQFSKPFLQVFGWMFVSMAIFFSIGSAGTGYMAAAILLVFVALGLVIITHVKVEKIQYWILTFLNLLGILCLIFFPSSLQNGIYMFGAVFVVIGLNYSSLMIVHKIDTLSPGAPPASPPTAQQLPPVPKKPPHGTKQPPLIHWRLPRASFAISDKMKDTLMKIATAKKLDNTVQALRFKKETLTQKALLNPRSAGKHQAQMDKTEQDIQYYKHEIKKIYAQIDTPLIDGYKRLKTMDETIDALEVLLKEKKVAPSTFDTMEDQIRFEQISLKRSLRQKTYELLSLQKIIEREIELLETQKVEFLNQISEKQHSLPKPQLVELQNQFHELLKLIEKYHEYLSGLETLQKQLQ